MKEQKCNGVCKKTKPIEAFYKAPANKSGYESTCISCKKSRKIITNKKYYNIIENRVAQSATHRQLYLSDRENQIEISKQYYKDNTRACKETSKRYLQTEEGKLASKKGAFKRRAF